MPRVSSPLDKRVTARFGGVRIRMRRRVLVGLAMLLGGPIVSMSLAATLTINGTGNAAVEFGQGSQVAVGCDTTINTAITEVWDTPTVRFKVESIVLTNLDNRRADTATIVNNQGCGNKAIRISLIDTGTAVMTIGNVARSSVTLIVPSIQIGNVDTGTASVTTGQWDGTANAPTSGVSGTWPLSTIWSAGTTNMLGGRAYISAAETSTATLKYFLPTTLSIDPGQVLRVALETL
jgi:hypothetical protein